jgi:hypothetical protein
MSNHVGFVVDKVALGQDISEYFDVPYQFAYHRPHRMLHTHLSSGDGTIGPIVAVMPTELKYHPTP